MIFVPAVEIKIPELMLSLIVTQPRHFALQYDLTRSSQTEKTSTVLGPIG